MSSSSVSVSTSDECCFPAPDCDPCADWLDFYCDFVTVTLDSCDATTEFTHAKKRGMKMTTANPQAGIHPLDSIFELSMAEFDVEVSAGGTLTESDGTVWTIYAVEDIPTFCLKRVWARSVAVCFSLLGDIDVFEENPDCNDECGGKIRFKRVARTKGNVTASTGSSLERNDARELVYRFDCALDGWPLRGLPKSKHRLKFEGKTYRISRVDMRGSLMPLYLGLEVDSDNCC
jgi:hypothetical protein